MAKVNIADECKGSYATGDACDNCARCFRERRAIAQAKNNPPEIETPKRKLPKAKPKPKPKKNVRGPIVTKELTPHEKAERRLFIAVYEALSKYGNECLDTGKSAASRQGETAAITDRVIALCKESFTNVE